MLTSQDKEFIQKCTERGCQCGLSPDSAREIGHLVGCLRDLGDGNLNKGIENFRAGISWVRSIQGRGEKIGGAVAIWATIAILGGAFTMIGFGIRAIVISWKQVP